MFLWYHCQKDWLKSKPYTWQVGSHPSPLSSSLCCLVKQRLAVYFWRPKGEFWCFVLLFEGQKSEAVWLFLLRLKTEGCFLFFSQRSKSRGQSFFFSDTKHQRLVSVFSFGRWQVKASLWFLEAFYHSHRNVSNSVWKLFIIESQNSLS